MKRKITGAILIALSFSFLWQALGQRRESPRPCLTECNNRLEECDKFVIENYTGRIRHTQIQKCVEEFHRCLGNCVH
jgi:hypothetical protein